ncbi:uncharacterized protein N7484_010534 [Penicillium longicatenatum]|uniref:uncharacterized protein n=1 Tax=Penicillium longicatenatum TaxID=1561947 RepID=UPI002549727B|nr:uncharacterized protein N7484_010534 [Penicillium longicatenatum]KAJ5630434.1 hypothetical protein N7484_010534 [Penicillium longicatenatum]
MAGKVAINDLGPDHLAAFKLSLQRIWSIKLVEDTFAQIVDGIPVEHLDTELLFQYDEEIFGRTHPSDDALDEVARWKSKFQIESFSIDAERIKIPRGDNGV